MSGALRVGVESCFLKFGQFGYFCYVLLFGMESGVFQSRKMHNGLLFL